MEGTNMGTKLRKKDNQEVPKSLLVLVL
jgi:hypothetical protein